MPDALVTIRAYSTLFEADLARSELEAFGFSVFLADVDTIHMNWLWSNALGGIKVQVLESEAEEAQQILCSQPDEPQEGQDISEGTVGACPYCGSTNTSYLLDKRGSFLTWLILGVPVIPAVSRRVCSRCQHKWNT